MDPSLIRCVCQPRTIPAIRAIDTVHAIRTVGKIRAACAESTVGAIIAVFAIRTIGAIAAVCTVFVVVIPSLWLRVQEQKTGSGTAFIDV